MQTPLPERVVHFPEDHSIGVLYVRDWDSTLDWRYWNGWLPLGEAQGAVTVPQGKNLRLIFIGKLVQDLSLLAEIGKDDLHSLALAGRGTIKFLPASDYTRPYKVSNLTITGEDLRFIREFRSLRELRLVGAEISDVGLAHLGGLTSLEALYLHNTDIGDTGLMQIGNLTSINEIQIFGTTVTDKGLAELKGLPSLRRLLLINNPKISDAGLIYLLALTRLEFLDLRSSSITDKGLTYLQSMRSLKHLVLDLSGTQITPNGLASLKLALPVHVVGFMTPTPSPTPSPIPPTQVPVS